MERQAYPSDVSDDEWSFVAPYLTFAGYLHLCYNALTLGKYVLLFSLWRFSLVLADNSCYPR